MTLSGVALSAEIQLARLRLLMLLELADTIDDRALRVRLLTMVVVGGGFTGVEAAGEV